MTGNEPQPERPDRPVDQPPRPGQPGYEQYASPGESDQPGYDQPTYGQPPGYDQPTYGQSPGYGQYGWPTYPAYPTYPGYTIYPYPPPYPIPPPDSGARNQAIVSLICNIIASLFCCFVFSIAGIVLSAIAIGRSERDPTSARKLVNWSWGALAAAVVAGIAAFVLLIVFMPEES